VEALAAPDRSVKSQAIYLAFLFGARNAN